MKRIIKNSLMIGSLVLAACSTQKEVTMTQLAGKWNIVNANGVDATTAEEPAYIIFKEDGAVNGYTSVNGFFGGYTLNNGKISFGNMGMTRKMGASMDVEDAVTRAMGSAAAIKVKKNTATLLNESGDVIMTLKK